MGEIQVEIFRQWIQALPEQDISLENAVTRILSAIDDLITGVIHNDYNK